MPKRVIGLFVVIGILALPTGSATAGPSCVGQHSSTVARQAARRSELTSALGLSSRTSAQVWSLPTRISPGMCVRAGAAEADSARSVEAAAHPAQPDQ
jgi:hypothetical protein